MYSITEEKFQEKCEIIRLKIIELKNEIELIDHWWIDWWIENTTECDILVGKLEAYEECYNLMKDI